MPARIHTDGASVDISFIGLREALAGLTGAPDDLRREMRAIMREIGNVARRVWRQQFSGRLTDPETRRRADTSSSLGRFSGASARAIGVRVRIGKTNFKVYVGPRGGAGIPGPGFYLAFHEFGLSKPKRPTAAKADALVRPGALLQIEDGLNKILRGW